MITNQRRRMSRLGLLLALTLCASCSRAPSFDILGSFFPAWLVCFAAAIVLTVVARLALLRLHIEIALPSLTYLCLTASFTFLLWLLFFR